MQDLKCSLEAKESIAFHGFSTALIPKRLGNSDSNDLYKSFLGKKFFSNCNVLASSSYNACIWIL